MKSTKHTLALRAAMIMATMFHLLTFDSEVHAQLTGLTTETVVVHDGSIPELLGYTTYRVYAELSSDLDFVSAVYGDDTAPLSIGCDGCTFFQSSPGGVSYNLGPEINTLFFSVYPDLEYDSWLTIGSESVVGSSEISVVGDGLTDGLDLFNQGSGFSVDDAIGGSWFNLFPCAGVSDLAACAEGNPAFAGEDNRVLLAQLTANGDIYGILNVQVFVGGSQDNEEKAEYLPFSSESTAVFGCTDDAADNYNPDATVDDGSCVYPCSISMSLNEVVAPSCFGENDASIEVVATGAQGADWFFLDSIPAGAYDAPTAYGGQNFGIFSDIDSDNYTVLVFDAAGCTDTLEVEVPVTPAIEATAGLTSGVSCAGESDAVLTLDTVSGGNGGYFYILSNSPDTVSTPVWENLPGDIAPYVTVIDSLGCIGQSNTVEITDPAPIDVGYANAVAENSVADATCSYTMDGAISLIGSGGSAPSTIQFSVDGENYFPSPLMVSGGSYTVTARDINGCIGTMEETVEVGPDAIEVTGTVSQGSADGEGTIETSVMGGTSPYTYQWTGEGVDGQTSADVDSLSSGDFTIAVTDYNGCYATETFTIETGTSMMGCTDMDACNYNGEATDDDNSCLYPGDPCDDMNDGTGNDTINDDCECVGEGADGVEEGRVSFGMFPNPTTGEVTLTVAGFHTGATVQVMDGAGRVVYAEQGVVLHGNKVIDLSALRSGTYNVMLRDERGVSVKRLAIQR